MSALNTRIDIPISVVFTEEGIDYFASQKKKVVRFKLSDGTEEYGFQVVDFLPQTVQRMQLLGYISKFELPAGNIFKKRKEFIDLIKLLTYGMLYRQFATSSFDAIVESELIQQWNRHNIKNPIDHKTKLNPQVINNFLTKNQTVILDIKNKILEPILKRIEISERMQDTEKQTATFLAQKYVDNLNPLLLFVLTVHHGSTAYFKLIPQIQKFLASYMDRASIPEYLALMMVELLTSLKMEKGLVNPEIINQAGESDIYVISRISKKKNEPGDRGKLHLMISNKRQSFEDIKNRINSRITTQVSGRNLRDFYDSSPEMQEGMHLGLYYLSYLSEACKKVNINLESFVNRIEKEYQTTIHLILTF